MENLKYAISMLLKIKNFVLSSETGKEREQFLTLITGCGKFTIAGHIDNIVETLLEQQTALADYKFKYRLADGINQQWYCIGFEENPEDMSDEQKAELRAIAKKFYPDEGEDDE